MLKYLDPLDSMFRALADPSRRRMIERLSSGSASVSELAELFAMSMPAVMQHIGVLEESGIVGSTKTGRIRSCHLEPAALNNAEKWLTAHRLSWEKQLDQLGALLAEKKDADR